MVVKERVYLIDVQQQTYTRPVPHRTNLLCRIVLVYRQNAREVRLVLPVSSEMMLASLTQPSLPPARLSWY
jgi:hypothetical protein